MSSNTLSSWVETASKELKHAGVQSARLDAELIMSHTIRKGRTYLHAHGDEDIEPRYLDILDTRLALRLDRVPLAYIIGHKEFYGRRFTVTPATLIPRPESEPMIGLLKEVTNQAALPLPGEIPRLVDVGTGSGCLGITAKLELPELEVTLIDTSRHALTVAEANAKRLGSVVSVVKSNLLQQYHYEATYILANLPYVDKDWEVSPETNHEPQDALYAVNKGLALIYRLLEEAKSRLVKQGYLFIEADMRQHQDIIQQAKTTGYSLKTSRELILVFQPT